MRYQDDYLQVSLAQLQIEFLRLRAALREGDTLALEGLKLKLDQSTLTGRIALESIARKALRFELALDALDADRYLPPPADAAQPLEVGGFEARGGARSRGRRRPSRACSRPTAAGAPRPSPGRPAPAPPPSGGRPDATFR